MAAIKQTSPVKNTAGGCRVSPMHQWMLLHNLSAPHSGVAIEQILCTLPEELDVAAFRQAWERVVDRHAFLRTSFRVEGVEPRQEVHRQVRLHIEEKDWSGLGEAGQKRRLEAYLQAARRRGFELSVPPLMRLALFHT